MRFLADIIGKKAGKDFQEYAEITGHLQDVLKVEIPRFITEEAPNLVLVSRPLAIASINVSCLDWAHQAWKRHEISREIIS
jgi:hypothetical protein